MRTWNPHGRATLMYQCTQNVIRGCQAPRGHHRSLGFPEDPGLSFQIPHRPDSPKGGPWQAGQRINAVAV